MLNISQRNNSLLLIPPSPSSQFAYLGPKTWNTLYKKLLTSSDQDLTTTVSFIKNSLKKLLIKCQKEHEVDEWRQANFIC